MITASTVNGTTYYTTIARGVEYCANQTAQGDWWVSTRRIALGRMHVPGGKYYDTIEQIAAKVKAFTGLDLLIK